MTRNTVYIILTLYKAVLITGSTGAVLYFFITGLVKNDKAAMKNAGIVFVSVFIMMLFLAVIEFIIALN